MSKAEELKKIRNNLSMAHYCKLWWKQFTKQAEKLQLSKEMRIIVYCDMCKGFFLEALQLCKNGDDYTHVNNLLDMLKDEYGVRING